MLNTFHFRNKTVTELIKLGDLLGRSLRENVEIFNIDGESSIVSYITQSDKVITGKYDLTNLALTEIKVEESDTYKDNSKFDKYVSNHAAKFINDVYTDNYAVANYSFQTLIKLWEQRIKFNVTKQKLEEKTSKFNITSDILNTKEYQQLSELFPKLVEHLKANKSKIEKISEISNSLKLSNTLAKGFNLPKITYKNLEESKQFKVTNPYSTSIYEMICTQELIKKEIIENKNSFSDIWVNNPLIKKLALLINEPKKDKVYEALANVVLDVPFIALATKKQIYTVISSPLTLESDLNESLDEKDIKQYASRIFDLCKPVRKSLIENLNTKYGVNILNLKEPASFKSLLNTQVVLFETLTRVAPKDSLLKEKLSAFTELLKSKNGVAAIDLNEVVYQLFKDAGYTLNEADLAKYINFDALSGELGNVSQILAMIKQVAAKGQALAGQNAPLAGAPTQTNPMAKPAITPSSEQAPLGTDDDDVGQIDPNAAMGPEGEEEGELDQGGMEQDPNSMNSPDSGGVPEEPAIPMSRDDLVATIQNLDMLTQELKASLGLGDDEEGMYSEPGHMEPDGDEAGLEGELGQEGEEIEGEGNPFEGGKEEEGESEEAPEDEEDGGEEEETEEAPPKAKKKEKGKPPFKKGGKE